MQTSNMEIYISKRGFCRQSFLAKGPFFFKQLKCYDWTNINGTVSYNGSPVCAMVLANGQYMFTSSEDGAFSIDVPLDEYGQITVFTFCSGLAPFQKVVYPAEGHGMMVDLQESNQGQGMNVTCGLQPINTDWVRLAGIATYNGTPLCAMILANGQYMFTSQANGYYTLDVPMDDFGNITQFVFCNGLPPYQRDYTAYQINFNVDTDGDGYSIPGGDCNDLDPTIHPWADEICGDGIDQDCNGSDLQCTSGTSNSTYISDLQYSPKTAQAGSGLIDVSGKIKFKVTF